MRTRFFNLIGALILASGFIFTQTLFISEAAEGSSNNKYLEIFNAGDSDVDMSSYSLSSCSNGCDTDGVWDYPDNVTFAAGTTLAAGDVYVVCHGSADDAIQAECDQTFTYLSNGDDVFALTAVGGGEILDIIGTTGGDPGSGWAVCGESNATKDHTLVRKSSVTQGNAGDWDASAGTDSDDCEWIVYDQNTWDYVGSHDMDVALTNTLSLGEATDSSLEILYSAIEPIGGFQFDVSGVNVSGGSGGDSAGAGFVISAAGSTVLGFSFTGSTIPAGSGLLVNLDITPTGGDICLEGVVMAGDVGQQLSFDIGPCIQNCEDADADGVCDDVDDCVGDYDECGVCNGDGIADGACDCDGNIADCAGTCLSLIHI